MSHTTQETTLHAQNLMRSFGQNIIIHDLSITLKRGEILGLLGHNGAGKSTTMQMLTGCLLPDKGQVQICGVDLHTHAEKAKQQLGYLPETPPLYRELTVDQYLKFTAQLRRIDKSEIKAATELVKQRCGLEHTGKKIISSLSKGYQQRVGIAQAIIHRPSVIILDEPTVGLDPSQLRDIRQLIANLGKEHSIIFSSHLLSEVEALCDRVNILHQGRIIYSNTQQGLQDSCKHGLLICFNAPPRIEDLQNIQYITEVQEISAGQFRIFYTPEHNPSSQLVSLANEYNWQLTQLTPLHNRLEDMFLSITQSNTGAKS